jgi:hypothetical protein
MTLISSQVIANTSAPVSPGLAPPLHRFPASVPPVSRFPIGDPASILPYVERFSLRYWSAFGVWKVRDDGCLLVCIWLQRRCCLVSVWFSFGSRWFGLGLPVLACWFLFGSLIVRSSGPVLDGVDDLLDVICVVCLLGLLGQFAWTVCLDSLLG